jgi:hypothetical protein
MVKPRTRYAQGEGAGLEGEAAGGSALLSLRSPTCCGGVSASGTKPARRRGRPASSLPIFAEWAGSRRAQRELDPDEAPPGGRRGRGLRRASHSSPGQSGRVSVRQMKTPAGLASPGVWSNRLEAVTRETG